MIDEYGEPEIYDTGEQVVILWTVYERDTAAEERIVRRGVEIASRLLAKRASQPRGDVQAPPGSAAEGRDS
jgi:hypothetical protein